MLDFTYFSDVFNENIAITSSITKVPMLSITFNARITKLLLVTS